MTSTDPIMMFVVQTVIVLFTILLAYRDFAIRKKEQTAGMVAEVIRSDKSMGSLYTVYGAAIASCLLLIDKSTGIEGHKVALIIIDFICFTYAFFFSSWFRNAVFFTLIQRVRKD
ncbi:hypothetical protein GPA22_16975 [Aromatoleum toluvorans]|uniref:Uncharacterized protein n=1 Tax=Aromatoleum toluvorans TaxID=92002 RepID=A0ABX1Q4X9_9RHOO|nr:hypothetical protein [Aromatoleum toluvorans]NMG45411.1 hypothetical protein [Aromatoleum toluvorans]